MPLMFKTLPPIEGEILNAPLKERCKRGKIHNSGFYAGYHEYGRLIIIAIRNVLSIDISPRNSEIRAVTYICTCRSRRRACCAAGLVLSRRDFNDTPFFLFPPLYTHKWPLPWHLILQGQLQAEPSV